MEESEEASENYDKETKEKQEKDLEQRKDAEEVRQRALESLAQTEKRHADERSQSSSSRKRPKKSGSETMLYLERIAKKEFDLRKELRIKKEEMELQKEIQLETTRKQTTATENMVKIVEGFQIQHVNLQQQMLQQQQQFQMMMQQLFLSVIEKLSKN